MSAREAPTNRMTITCGRVAMLAGVVGLSLVLIPQSGAAQGPPPGRGQPPGRAMGPPAAPPASISWRVEVAAQTNLWFHALAVIAADQPGPLGLYSADYARYIRDFKQQLGVYPTALDSLAPDLRASIGDGRDLEVIHFVPLYFPQAEPERMLQALRAVVKRKNDPALVGRDVGFGVAVMRQATQDGKTRSVLGDLVDAVEKEWNVFYRQYWQEIEAQQDSLARAMQAVWDADLAPGLAGYLEEHRLTGGIVMPSAALGPEGRIVELQDYNPGDQVVAVQDPLLVEGPEATVFAFLKELCFLLIDDQKLNPDPLTLEEREDLRRTAAVRCGAQLLQFYVPEQASRYRRAFLDAVGAEESNTVDAFERIYYLDPITYRRLHQQLRTQ